MKRDRSVAVVIFKDKLLVIHRDNAGDKYFTLPGGGIEEGETAIKAVVREVMEEASITVRVQKEIYELEYEDGIHHYYLCEYLSGEPRLGEGTNEKARHDLGTNLYTPQWLAFDKLPDSELYPRVVRDWISQDEKTAFSDGLRKYRVTSEGWS